MSRIAAFAVIAACGHSHPSGPDATPAPDAGADPRVAAATTTATTSPTCTALGGFYWEIGDAHGALASGSIGGITADTAMGIASASKLVFGAYVVDRFAGDLSQIDHDAMTMQSGYVSLDYTSCLTATTVDDCLAKGQNGVQTASAVGHFDYDGGHFQHYASVLGLGADDDAALAAAMGLPYSSPQLAAGIRTTPADYAAFLRKILDGTLAIHDHLGEAAVCTLPGSSCPTAIYSPAAPYAWHYSYGHWIEDDASQGDDGAFSSPGAYGFYPWIDRTETYYGVVARQSFTKTAYIDSALCGRLIRKAWTSGEPQ
jgi:hypothetical protein